jgi:hypothetical protein
MSRKHSIQTCPDSHHCENGGQCVQNPYDEGSYYCDCAEYIWDARYEGLYCEHKAEVYCVANSKGVSNHAFCTNGGTCKEYISPNEAHLGCDCKEGFEGSFCQYVTGSRPEGWPYTPSKDFSAQPSGGTSALGAIIGSLVSIFAVGLVVTAVLYRRYMHSREEMVNSGMNKPLDGITGRDLELQPDGAQLKEAVQQQTISSPTSIISPVAPTNRPMTSDSGMSFGDEGNEFSKDDDEDSALSIT